MLRPYMVMMQSSSISLNVLTRVERFWESFDAPETPHELLKFSAFMGLFPFAGYLFSYTIVGKIWNLWPFIQTTLTVPPALIFAGMQWIFFMIFPALSALILEFLLTRWKQAPLWHSSMTITTYSMVPLCLAALFASVPFFGRIFAVAAVATFLYLHYYGYRIYLEQSFLRSAGMTLAVMILFALIRQMFVFVIGF